MINKFGDKYGNNQMKIHYGDNRDITRDTFELCLSQIFLGPVELPIPKDEFSSLKFSYGVTTKKCPLTLSDRFQYGTLCFTFLNKDGGVTVSRIMLTFIEKIQILPPTPNTNYSGGLMIQLSKMARMRLRKTLGLSKEHAYRKFPLTYTHPEDALKHLIFIFKSWNSVNPDHIIRTKPHSKYKFHNFEELRSRFNYWLIIVRQEDFTHLGNDSENSIEQMQLFFRIITTREWFDFMKYLNIEVNNNANTTTGFEYRYCRPGQIPAIVQIKSRGVEVFSLHRSPNSKSDWIETIPKCSNDEILAKTPIRELKNSRKIDSPTVLPKKRAKRIVDIVLEDDIQKHSQPKMDITKCTNLLSYGKGKNSVSLTFSDIEKLAPGQLLNDSIIEFYLQYILLERLSPETAEKVHIFNTFLFAKLVKNNRKSASLETLRGRELFKKWIQGNYDSVKKWTRGIDIFSKKILVFPVNFEEHWYVVMVFNPGNAIKKQTENGKQTNNQKTVILVLNSLFIIGCPIAKTAADVVRHYLTFEYADKVQENAAGQFSQKHIVNVPIKDLPGQMNSTDCGVFLLAYVELILCWMPKLQGKVFNFNRWWPSFNRIQMKLMRYKILAIIRSKVDSKIWSDLKQFEEKPDENAEKNESTEAKLEQQLENTGIQRWSSEPNLSPIIVTKRKRVKSVDRCFPDDCLDREFYLNLAGPSF